MYVDPMCNILWLPAILEITTLQYSNVRVYAELYILIVDTRTLYYIYYKSTHALFLSELVLLGFIVIYTLCCLYVCVLYMLESLPFLNPRLFFSNHVLGVILLHFQILLVFTPYTIFHVLFHVKYVNIIVLK